MRLASRSALFFATLFLLAGVLTTLPAAAQEGALDSAPPKGTTPDEIIKRFADREKLFKEARDHYTYRQDITVKILDSDANPPPEYREV
ncbi:MAG: hypothetical protein WBF15_03225, partial [Candidatus Sulfotelmatobacter sp.]